MKCSICGAEAVGAFVGGAGCYQHWQWIFNRPHDRVFVWIKRMGSHEYVLQNRSYPT